MGVVSWEGDPTQARSVWRSRDLREEVVCLFRKSCACQVAEGEGLGRGLRDAGLERWVGVIGEGTGAKSRSGVGP